MTRPIRIVLTLSCVSFVLAASKGKCTDQERDVIVINGEKSFLVDCPLIYYWNDKENPRPSFDVQRTSNWKGFTVNWELKDDRLWAIGFEAKRNGIPVDPKDVFGNPLPIFASWVNGPEYIVENLSGTNIRGFTSESWQRIFLIDGVVRKRSSGNSAINCNRGYVGITLGTHNGEIIAEKIQANSPAARFGMRPGMVISGIIDIDDETVLFDDFSAQKALQCMRGLLDDRLKLIPKQNDPNSTVVELVRVRSSSTEEQNRK